MTAIAMAPHPTLRVAAFTTRFDAPLGDRATPPWLVELLHGRVVAPFAPDEVVRTTMRDVLRHGGYKPTGRGKPASEYLIRAATDGTLRPINTAVDACNVASLHSGFPISVVDLDRARPPFRIAVAGRGDRYVFNAAGQEIDLDGLVSLFDADGPCANAVKDAQRTKTGDATTRTLSVVWGAAAHEQRLGQVTRWYRDLLERAGAATGDVQLAAG
jgi:DNA/RNA-binding domain of Phe-tRNA-synthetase-like protein